MCIVAWKLMENNYDEYNINSNLQNEMSDNKDNQSFNFKEEFVLKDQKEIEKIMKHYNISSDSSITEVIYSPLINMAEEENQASEKSSEILTETVSVQEICELYFSSWYMAPSGARNIEETFEAKIDVKLDKNVINAVKTHYNLESFQFASSIKTQEVQVKEGCKKNMMGYLYQENSSFTVTNDGKEIYQGIICIPKGLILLVSEDIRTL